METLALGFLLFFLPFLIYVDFVRFLATSNDTTSFPSKEGVKEVLAPKSQPVGCQIPDRYLARLNFCRFLLGEKPLTREGISQSLTSQGNLSAISVPSYPALKRKSTTRSRTTQCKNLKTYSLRKPNPKLKGRNQKVGASRKTTLLLGNPTFQQF